MKKVLLTAAALGMAIAAIFTNLLNAADHLDSPQASADQSVDIDDVFAWMAPGANQVNLVMTFGRNIAPGFQFSDAVDYIFRVTSQPSLGAAATTTNVVCTFTTNQVATCSVGDVTVSGNASSPVGIMSPGGEMRLFAGPRNDPFFFNLNGFRATAEAVANAAPSLTFDGEGCPALDAATSNALVQQLSSEPNGSAATDDFANSNVLAIVLQINTNLLNAGGPILGVSGITSN